MVTGDSTRYDLVRVDRTTGKATTVPRTAPILGRWLADEERRRLEQSNRDPNIVIEVRKAGMTQDFRAAAFSDVTHKFKNFRDE